jgi:predicted dehydrogenase
VLRFWPEYEELHAVIRSGELGRPLAASALRLSPPVGWNDWMIDGVQSGGAAVDMMVHDFDQLNALLGPARSVAARAVTSGPFDAPQHVVAVVAHDGGAGLAEGGLMLPDSYPFTSNIRVLCERGVAEYGFAAGPAVGGGNIGGVDQDANRLRIHPRGEPSRFAEVVSGDPWHRQAAYLAECVERGTPPDRATGEQAVAALRVSLAANRSLASEREEAVV